MISHGYIGLLHLCFCTGITSNAKPVWYHIMYDLIGTFGNGHTLLVKIIISAVHHSTCPIPLCLDIIFDYIIKIYLFIRYIIYKIWSIFKVQT